MKKILLFTALFFSVQVLYAEMPMDGGMEMGMGRSSMGHGGVSGGHRGRMNGETPGFSNERGRNSSMDIPEIRQILTYDKELELTDKQVSDIKEIKVYSGKAVQLKLAEIEKERAELAQLMSENETDFEKVREKLKAIQNTSLDIQLEAINNYEKALNILTASQKEALRNLKNNKKSRFKERMIHYQNQGQSVPSAPAKIKQ